MSGRPFYLAPPFYLALAAAAFCAGCAAPRAALEAEPLDAFAYGVVESIGEAPPSANSFEHAVKPEGDEILVRLEDGSTLTVVQDAPLRLAAGERVVVIRERHGARIESVLPM